jgi:hypothetical protein
MGFLLLALFLIALACALIAMPAILCVELRKPRAYFVFLACFCLFGSIIVSLTELVQTPHRIVPSDPLMLLLIFLPLGVLYAFFPGLDVLSAELPRKILRSTVVASVIGGPLWYWYAMWVVCAMGSSCI